jgi:glutaconate CoA-transferase subunit A
MTKHMEIVAEGQGELLGWHDPDENRAWVRDNKQRGLIDKRMSVAEAIQRFVHDGDYVAFGGFGHIRIPMAFIYHELRGLSPAGRRGVESGKVKVVAEISNGGYQWRFLAGMMGVPFIPVRNLMGTDTFARSVAKQVRDPWSGKSVTLVPAAYPDVAFFHVPRCDKYGNVQIDGILVEDFELARAARRVLISTEEIVDEEDIRSDPRQTVIPFYVVDAVCEVPFGAHPTLMPYRYFFDEEHIYEWLAVSKTEEGAREYFEKYVFRVADYDEYLERVGGLRKLTQLKQIEQLRAPMVSAGA